MVFSIYILYYYYILCKLFFQCHSWNNGIKPIISFLYTYRKLPKISYSRTMQLRSCKSTYIKIFVTYFDVMLWHCNGNSGSEDNNIVE